jgi:tetratricopeptide (TPR) repeat protein
MDYLKTKVEEFKEKKKRKLERRAKWENWIKTQAMFYKKTSTNYHKWDCFESSEEEDPETDPIVPKDDPQFKAMEADFQERNARMKKDTKLAEECKVKGNEAMKRGLYKTANKHYTDGLEHKKGMMQLYTNRALARLKLEMWQDTVDDCTRVLEYCEVFDDGYEKQKDLCYKALTRRAQALRGMKEFQLAITDLESAQKLLPSEQDPVKLIALYKEDSELAARVSSIMANSESLKGKELIDFLLEFQQKAVETGTKRKLPAFCKNELTAENSEKLLAVFQAEKTDDLMLYFNAKNGFKVLVDSLEFNQEAIPVLTELLNRSEKLREEFQRQHLYEAMVEFLYKKNVNAEGATLEANVVFEILSLLENGSMVEAVRLNLSEKKKMKDLFLVVIKSIDIKQNRKLVASLIQFVSNLCYGTGKFRKMLLA